MLQRHSFTHELEEIENVETLEQKIAIVTGAGTGIGSAIARAFIEKGAKVAVVGRRLEKLQEIAAGAPKGHAACFPCDVGDRDAVNAMIEQVSQRLGTVNLLVNNAGINTLRRAVSDVDPKDWDRTIATNLTGAFNCARAVLPGMRRQRDGLIINIASIAGMRASKLAGAGYCASKHGMVALTHSISDEEREFGIRATAICPGEVETPILDLRPEPVSAEHRARILRPADVADVAVFVASLPARICIPEIIIKPTTQGFS